MTRNSKVRYRVENLILEKVNQAQPSTVYSELSEWTCQITKASEAQKVLFWILSRENEERTPWLTEKVYRVIAYRAFINNYLGEWEIVQAMLETKPQTYEAVKKKFLEYHSYSAFEGNYRCSRSEISRWLWKKPIGSTRQGTVRYPQRKRGYTDKGSRRLPHQYHGIPPYSDEKEDRRHLVQHPLLYEEKSGEEANFQDEEMTKTTSRKGGEG